MTTTLPSTTLNNNAECLNRKQSQNESMCFCAAEIQKREFLKDFTETSTKEKRQIFYM